MDSQGAQPGTVLQLCPVGSNASSTQKPIWRRWNILSNPPVGRRWHKDLRSCSPVARSPPSATRSPPPPRRLKTPTSTQEQEQRSRPAAPGNRRLTPLPLGPPPPRSAPSTGPLPFRAPGSKVVRDSRNTRTAALPGHWWSPVRRPRPLHRPKKNRGAGCQPSRATPCIGRDACSLPRDVTWAGCRFHGRIGRVA